MIQGIVIIYPVLCSIDIQDLWSVRIDDLHDLVCRMDIAVDQLEALFTCCNGFVGCDGICSIVYNGALFLDPVIDNLTVTICGQICPGISIVIVLVDGTTGVAGLLAVNIHHAGIYGSGVCLALAVGIIDLRSFPVAFLCLGGIF